MSSCKSYSHFFSKKFQHICVSLDLNFNELLTNLIVLGFNDRQPLRVILCRLPEKGRKEIEEIRGDEREGQGRKRNRNESEETEEIKTFPLYPYPLQG